MALVVPGGVALLPDLTGQFVAIRYAVGGPALYHLRFLAARFGNTGEYVGVTPDGDLYSELYQPTPNPDIQSVHLLQDPDDAPPGARDNQMYRFAPAPNAMMQAQLGLQGQIYVRQNGGVPGPLLAPVGGAAPPAGALPAAPAPAQVDGAPGGALPGGGLAALAAALGGAPGLAPAGVQGIAPGLPPAIGDARTLPVLFDPDGARYRDFKDGILACSQSAFGDWIIKGPRTTSWCLKFILESGGYPIAHSTKWRNENKIQATEPDAILHEFLCKLVQTGMCYDQLDLTNNAIFELIFRELQQLEQKHSEKTAARGDSGATEALSEHNLMMGLQQPTFMMSPELRTWISTELSQEAAVLKERRKAREERTLARTPKPKAEPKKGAKGEKAEA
jgi:hypothetical protein